MKKLSSSMNIAESEAKSLLLQMLMVFSVEYLMISVIALKSWTRMEKIFKTV